MSKITRRGFVGKSVSGTGAIAAAAAVFGLPWHVTAASPNNKVVLALMAPAAAVRTLSRKWRPSPT